MRAIEAGDAVSKLGELLDRVEGGEDVVITRAGRAVARLTSPYSSGSRSDAEKAAAAIRAMSRGVTLGGLSVRDLVAAGRM